MEQESCLRMGSQRMKETEQVNHVLMTNILHNPNLRILPCLSASAHKTVLQASHGSFQHRLLLTPHPANTRSELHRPTGTSQVWQQTGRILLKAPMRVLLQTKVMDSASWVVVTGLYSPLCQWFWNSGLSFIIIHSHIVVVLGRPGFPKLYSRFRVP